jgi:hypothetical protein
MAFGQVVFDFTAGIAAGAAASASASCQAPLTTASKVFLNRENPADAGIAFLMAGYQASGHPSGGMITMTAMNASAANKSASTQYSYSFFAIR